MASGTWAVLGGGAWANAANWSGGTIADGAAFTATFATNIPAAGQLYATIDTTLGAGWTGSIGSMTFSDNGTSGAAWVLDGGVGTLNHPSGTTVTTTTTVYNFAPVNVPVGQTFTKAGSANYFAMTPTSGASSIATLNISLGTVLFGTASGLGATTVNVAAGQNLSADSGVGAGGVSGTVSLAATSITFNTSNTLTSNLFGGNLVFGPVTLAGTGTFNIAAGRGRVTSSVSSLNSTGRTINVYGTVSIGLAEFDGQITGNGTVYSSTTSGTTALTIVRLLNNTSTFSTPFVIRQGGVWIDSVPAAGLASAIGTNATLTFGSGAAGQVASLYVGASSPQTLDRTLTTSASTITGRIFNASPTGSRLTVPATRTLTIGASQSFYFMGAGGPITVSMVMANSGANVLSPRVANYGVVTFTAANTFTGTFAVENGVAIIDNASALPAGVAVSLGNNSTILFGSLVIGASGPASVANTVTFAGASNTSPIYNSEIYGNIRIERAGVTLSSPISGAATDIVTLFDTTVTSTIAGSSISFLPAAGTTVTVSPAGTFTPGTFSQAGAGTTILNAALGAPTNQYAVTKGRLVVQNLGSSSGSINVGTALRTGSPGDAEAVFEVTPFGGSKTLGFLNSNAPMRIVADTAAGAGITFGNTNPSRSTFAIYEFTTNGPRYVLAESQYLGRSFSGGAVQDGASGSTLTDLIPARLDASGYVVRSEYGVTANWLTTATRANINPTSRFTNYRIDGNITAQKTRRFDSLNFSSDGAGGYYSMAIDAGQTVATQSVFTEGAAPASDTTLLAGAGSIAPLPNQRILSFFVGQLGTPSPNTVTVAAPVKPYRAVELSKGNEGNVTFTEPLDLRQLNVWGGTTTFAGEVKLAYRTNTNIFAGAAGYATTLVFNQDVTCGGISGQVFGSVSTPTAILGAGRVMRINSSTVAMACNLAGLAGSELRIDSFANAANGFTAWAIDVPTIRVNHGSISFQGVFGRIGDVGMTYAPDIFFDGCGQISFPRDGFVKRYSHATNVAVINGQGAFSWNGAVSSSTPPGAEIDVDTFVLPGADATFVFNLGAAQEYLTCKLFNFSTRGLIAPNVFTSGNWAVYRLAGDTSSGSQPLSRDSVDSPVSVSKPLRAIDPGFYNASSDGTRIVSPHDVSEYITLGGGLSAQPSIEVTGFRTASASPVAMAAGAQLLCTSFVSSAGGTLSGGAGATWAARTGAPLYITSASVTTTNALPIVDGATPTRVVYGVLGTFTNNAANSYSGGSVLAGTGIVSIGNDATFGSGQIDCHGGRINTNGAAGTTRTVANNLYLGAGGLSITGVAAHTLNLTGNMSGPGGIRYSAATTDTLNLSGAMTATGQFITFNTSVVNFNAASTFSEYIFTASATVSLSNTTLVTGRFQSSDGALTLNTTGCTSGVEFTAPCGNGGSLIVSTAAAGAKFSAPCAWSAVNIGANSKYQAFHVDALGHGNVNTATNSTLEITAAGVNIGGDLTNASGVTFIIG